MGAESRDPMRTHIGKFEILRLLGQGAMGEVFLGRDPSIGREVAIKTIRPALVGVDVGGDVRQRFAREAQAAGLLHHPHVVTVFEFGTDEDLLYLVMEYVPGEDLAALMARDALQPSDLLEILAQVCEGLAQAHKQGIIHRDIKPTNIMVQREQGEWQAKVMDFGVAKLSGSEATQTGQVVGTLAYMAPEYLQSGHPDARSDLFAVGVLLYEALAGVPPFDGPSPGSVIYRLLHETPAPLPPTAFQGISRDVQGLLNHALSKDPSNRFQSAEDLAGALRGAKNPSWHWVQDHPTVAVQIKRPKGRGIASPTPPRGMPVVSPIPTAAPEPARSPAPPAKAASEQPSGRSEVRRDLLETTRTQLMQALEIDPTNPRVHALLLVTLYQLGLLESVIWILRSARDKGIPAQELLAVPRCEQVVQEEARCVRLTLRAHGEFMEFFGL